MPEKNNWFKRNVSKRNLIKKDENKDSYLQIIGFVLISVGIIYMTICGLINHDSTADGIAVSFFIIMLGMAFAFPSLLEGGDKEMSTMRIVVFMMVNVICVLLLKIGWNKEDLGGIKLDEYWMGVIAFIFGAKAAQAYFESRLASRRESPKEGMAALEYTNADIAKLAVEQNQQYLKIKFPNIVSVSDAVNNLNTKETHVVALYLKDNNTAGIPDKLEVRMPDGGIKTLSTEIVKGVGRGKININQKDEIRNGDSNGSICCVVETVGGSKLVVTAGHVFSKGNSTNFGGELDVSEQTPAQINKKISGNWFFQVINFRNDVALATIDNFSIDAACISFKDKEHYVVTDNDVQQTKVKVISNVTIPKERTAFILDYNTAWDVPYDDRKVAKNKIIVIGDSKDRLNSKTVSQEGDSGGCVYEEKSGQLVGLVLGGNDMFTWVLSLKEIFEKFNYKLI